MKRLHKAKPPTAGEMLAHAQRELLIAAGHIALSDSLAVHDELREAIDCLQAAQGWIRRVQLPPTTGEMLAHTQRELLIAAGHIALSDSLAVHDELREAIDCLQAAREWIRRVQLGQG